MDESSFVPMFDLKNKSKYPILRATNQPLFGKNLRLLSKKLQNLSPPVYVGQTGTEEIHRPMPQMHSRLHPQLQKHLRVPLCAIPEPFIGSSSPFPRNTWANYLLHFISVSKITLLILKIPPQRFGMPSF
ncbi:hypothetical protein CDAR_413441 [Caerostris darwini]|uniref:Uncharacterized protein n=1 Tax=Caerostris darwini TaxID=1538125 RepID=A0AAV4S9T0_9ARAC|nr:hypothetical protein CDAR_413441 [Caerostris darwini]